MGRGARWTTVHGVVVEHDTAQPSIPGSICSHVSEASAQNYSSLCCGYSLLIIWLTSSTWGFSSYKTAHGILLRILSIALEKELKGPWLCLMTTLLLVSFDCFPLLLHVLISLIKLIL